MLKVTQAKAWYSDRICPLSVRREDVSVSHATGRRRQPAGWSRFSRFLMVGALNAFVDLGILNLLLHLHPTHTAWLLTLYNTGAVLGAVLNSYLWNRWWTFRDTARGGKREFLSYLIQAAFNVVINDAVLTAADAWLLSLHTLPVLWADNAAKGLAMFTSSSVTYLCLRLWVFRRPRRAFT